MYVPSYSGRGQADQCVDTSGVEDRDAAEVYGYQAPNGTL
jgi:hypothetical protein